MTGLDQARALLQQNALDEAERVLWATIRANEDRVYEAWLRLGELHAARGHLRRAVGAFRRAQELDTRGEYALLLHQAVSTLGQVLHRAGRPFLHPSDELVRTKRLVAGAPLDAPTPDEWLERAKALEPVLSSAGVTALDEARTFVRRGRLEEAYSEQSPSRELELRGGEAARPLADALKALHLAWYEALLEAEEPSPSR